MTCRRLWFAFVAVIVSSFAILGWTGYRIYQEAPPVPARVVTTAGEQLIGPDEIHAGQNVWQSMGGMEVGSVWGHGSYVAPDWTADWLHRESTFILDAWAAPQSYADLPVDRQAALQARLERLVRTNTYDAATNTITVDPVRADAFRGNLARYADVFGRGRDEYAIPANTLTDRDRLRLLSALSFWTSWAASTNRPDSTVTYTSNWPHEPLVGNRPTGDTVVWTGVSVILLLLGIGVMASYYASRREHAPPADTPGADPLLDSAATPSQRAVVKYFWVVSALVVVQILLGVVTAHYGVELYYMQGLNTTPVHGHAALFGVYGMLGIGLMLFALRALDPVLQWKEGLIKFGFWATNIGLFAMVTLSLLPVGLMQTWASVETGYWYARSPEFMQTPIMDTFRWLRVVGDTVFAAGAIALALFVIGLRTGGASRRERFHAGDPLPASGRP